MSDRGSYRSIHTVLVDGPDYQSLSPTAKLVLLTLKLTLGPTGIDVVPALAAALEERTGCKWEAVDKALIDLAAAGWIKRERNVVWIIEGLAHEPSRRLNNAGHRADIERHLKSLPSLPIVDAFRVHYGLAEKAPEAPADAMPDAMGDGMGDAIPPAMGDHGRRKTEDGERRRKTEKTMPATSAGRSSWLTPFMSAWREAYGGDMPVEPNAKPLRKAVDEYGEPETLRRWKHYLRATGGQYANAARFAATWAEWDAPQQARASPPASRAAEGAANARAALALIRQAGGSAAQAIHLGGSNGDQ